MNPKSLRHCLKILLLACSTSNVLAGSTALPATQAKTQDTTKTDKARSAKAPAHCTQDCARLHALLSQLPANHTLIGHQNTTASGVNWLFEPGRSDIKDVTGSYPALFGWDLGKLEYESKTNLDGIPFEFIRSQVQTAHKIGAISTFSWHLGNPLGGTAWTRPLDLNHLLPGGSHHDWLLNALDNFVAFNRSLIYTDKAGKQRQIPVIFRPWHEHNGDWFWWGIGGNPAQAEAFSQLWQFTYDYLVRQHKVSNLLYAYSPDRSRLNPGQLTAGYFAGYPGDAQVDILGLDDYWDLGHKDNRTPLAEQARILQTSLSWLRQAAAQRGKIAALTETGQEQVPRDTFWTEVLLPPLLAGDDIQPVAYVMLWRNANYRKEGWHHYYAPFAGHPSAADFLVFYQRPETLFAGDLIHRYYK